MNCGRSTITGSSLWVVPGRHIKPIRQQEENAFAYFVINDCALNP